MEEEKPKKLEEYKQTKPEQLEAFQVAHLTYKELKNPYSNTADLYDAIPKYFWGKQQGQPVEQLKALERKFTYQNVEYSVLIQPAVIQAKDGTLKTRFPGEREELVEDALRKIACEGDGIFLDDSASVTFTLCQLEKELKSMGHHYNKDQIKEAIMICGSSIIKVRTKDGKSIVITPLFATVKLITQEDRKSSKKLTDCYVRFNSLVTKSIKAKTFRLINYSKSMTYKRVLARWLHKRISNNYRQASETDLYTISLARIINDSGIKQYTNIRNNLRDLKAALEEMKIKEVLAEYKVEQIIEGRRIIDVKITLIPHESFVKEMKFFNHYHNEIRSKEIREEAIKTIQNCLNRLPPPKQENP